MENNMKSKLNLGNIANSWKNLWNKRSKQGPENWQGNPADYRQMPQGYSQNYMPQQEQFYDTQNSQNADYGSLRSGYRSQNNNQANSYDYQSPQQHYQYDEYQQTYTNDNYGYAQDYSQEQYSNPAYAQNNYYEQQNPYQNPQAQYAQGRQEVPVARNNILDFDGNSAGFSSLKIGVAALFKTQDCLDMIALMQQQTMFVVNMENIADAQTRRSCVDILSGANAALNYNMTRLASSYIFLIVPNTITLSMNDVTKNLLQSYGRNLGTKVRYAEENEYSEEDYSTDEVEYSRPTYSRRYAAR